MSVRRTVRATAAGRATEMPERLRHLTIEDWVTPDERPPTWWWLGTLVSDDRPAETMSWLRLAAWTRHGEALSQWAKDQGLTWSEFCHSHEYDCYPRWRDAQEFWTRMLEAGDL